MASFVERYAAFVRQPGVLRLLLVALLSRMPIGMVGFALLVFLRQSLGDFAVAGATVGIYFVAMAAAAPVQGRIIDRIGPLPLLVITGIAQPLALLGILFTARGHASFALLAACAAAAGAFASPITTVTRTIWRTRFEREDDRRTAFALDAVTIEINFTLGPALVAVVLGTHGSTASFAMAIGAVVAATLIYLFSGALRLFKRVNTGERHLLGPLTEPRLLLVFAATFGLSTCFGIIEVGYPAFGTSLGMPAVAGLLLAINSAGSAAGGTLYGGMHFRAPVERQLAGAMALMALPLLGHALFLQAVPFGIVAFFAGALIAPSITAQSVLVARYAPPKYATEAFTWSSTFIVSGIGFGISLGGSIVEHAGIPAVFGLGAAIILSMSLLVLFALPAPRVAVPASD